MHPTAIFHAEADESAIAFIEAHPFATMAVNADNGPQVALVPLVLADDEAGDTNRLMGHVARHNLFWQAAADGPVPAAAVFHGPDAYVSPSVYPSKQVDGRVVPTWNYIALEVRGQLTVETRPDAIRPYLDAVTDKMEAHRAAPWQVSDAPDDYIDRLSRGIVGFELTVDEIKYVRKLSQNKSDSDHHGVHKSLATSPDPAAQLIAREMLKEKEGGG